MANGFKQKVLCVVSRIKKGRVLSYKKVAELAGRPRAWRAVGNILNKNCDKRIPCHRVVRADGSPGGYNRGIRRKLALLRKEGAGAQKRFCL
jgi:O-6-methylguanine DNA methyltransferase